MIRQDKELLQWIGSLISKARIENSLIQEQVANMLCVSRAQIANIERGNGTTPEMMLKLAAIFNCSVADLFPSPDQYKPKLKMPAPRKTKPGRKERGPVTSKPSFLMIKENEELKKQLEQYINQKEGKRQCSDCGVWFKSEGRCPECNPLG
jgi:transcriptional regulator with XRE-family HTH domain